MWILILFAHVGMGCSGNSNALDNVPGFQTAIECKEAGREAEKLASGTCKEVRFVCVRATGGK